MSYVRVTVEIGKVKAVQIATLDQLTQANEPKPAYLARVAQTAIDMALKGESFEPATSEWCAGPPPARGPYRVGSDKAGKIANKGWRYWTGERWLPMCRTRKDAMQSGLGFRVNPGYYRNTPSQYQTLWERKL